MEASEQKARDILANIDRGRTGLVVKDVGVNAAATLTLDVVAGLRERGHKSILVVAPQTSAAERCATLRDETGVEVLTVARIGARVPPRFTAVIVEEMASVEVVRIGRAIKAFSGVKVVMQPFAVEAAADWHRGTDRERARILAQQVFGATRPMVTIGKGPAQAPEQYTDRQMEIGA
jgi:hypothetical protein